MVERLDHIVRHLLPQPCSQALPLSPLDSPTGKVYPPGTDINLQGNLEPVSIETSGALICTHGKLPVDLDGFFARQGPNPVRNKEGQPYHAFTGNGMIHLIELHQGMATYRNRWVQTKALALERALNRESEMKMNFDDDGIMMGSANTNVIYHAKQLLALYETDRPYAVSLPDLETLGQQTYGGALKHTMTAHPKVCPSSGEMFFFGYDMTQPMIHYAVVSAQGELKLSLDIPTRCGEPVMMHDMAITQNYAVIMESPLCFQLRLAVKGLMPYAHDTSKPSWYGIVPRYATSTAEIRWFKGETGCSFHTANAWEEGQKVKLVATFSPKFTWFDPEAGDGEIFKVREWTFDLSTGKMEEHDVKPDVTLQHEFTQINPEKVGQPSRYVWAVEFATSTGMSLHSVHGLVKYDLASGSVLKHKFPDGRFGGEAVFAARANAVDEDDGYLLSLTYNSQEMTTELYVVDAKSMDQNPVAILRTPQRAPFGFHAYWLPKRLM